MASRSIVYVITIALIVSISGCTQPPVYIPPQTQNSSESITGLASSLVNSLNVKTAANEIAKLPTLDVDSIEQYEGYKTFAGDTNDIIRILREQTNFKDIPMLGETQEDFSKFLNVVEKWTPLIGNYNELVSSARNFDENNQSSVQKFYTTAATFAFETTIIYTAAFYGPSYNSVRAVYRGSGLQSLAFECSSCVSVVLSHAHWFVRTALVEASSKTFEAIVDCIPETNLTAESLTDITNCFVSKTPFSNITVENVTEGVGNLANQVIGGIGNITSSLGIKLP